MKINKFKLFAVLKYIWFPIFLACRIIRSVAWWQTEPSFKNWNFQKYFKYDLILLSTWLIIYFAPWYISACLCGFLFIIWLAVLVDSYNKQK